MNISGIWEKDGHKFRICVKDEGKTLLSLLQEHHIYLDAPCSGKGSCGKCKVRFLTEAPELTETEQRLLNEQEQKSGVRLACLVRPEGDCQIQIPEYGQEQMVVLAPENTAESGKLLQKTYADASAERGMMYVSYGIAVDIGTTTLVMALIDLATGEQKAVTTSVNHQRAFGADVISRIQAANAGKGTLLQKSILSDLRRMRITLIQDAHILPSQIKKIVIVGNTTMCHLLLGYSCATLGAAPFVPYDISLMKKTYREVFGAAELKAEVTVLPGISAFVGADIVAGIYASRMAEKDEVSMLLDIGTNGEMAIGSRNGCYVTSAAAGPVFEGGNISCGMAGVPGAVSHIRLFEDGSVSSYETIGGKPLQGLCGTGIIDITGELVRNHLIDENGTLQEPWFEAGIPVVKENIRFLQKDIREIQLGKSAIRAGIETLLNEYMKQDEMPEHIYLSGGFGYFMEVEKVIQIGMFPENFAGKVTVLGNSALEGAKRYLLEEADDAVIKIAGQAKEINLAMHSGFQDLYMEHMFFPGC